MGQGWELLGVLGGNVGGWLRKCYGILKGLMGCAKKKLLARFQVMSKEQFSALLAKLKDDAELQEKFKCAADLDAATAMAKEDGFDVNKADWLKHKASQTLDLSDEELEMLAGGGRTVDWLAWTKTSYCVWDCF